MGLRIDRETFAESDYARFAERLEQCLEAFGELLERPGFGVGPASLGAELETSLVDDACRPLLCNDAVLRETVDPRMTVELDRFNMECNLRWAHLRGRPFGALRAELDGALAELRRAAGAHGARVALIGVLPTLREADLQRSAMTDEPRYRALSAGLQRLRRNPFRVKIDGPEPLEVMADDVTFEGANTSLQLHLRVEPEAFARTYNAVQLATAPVLAVSCNSPTFLGHRLWDETRVALFKQAVDDRSERGGREARVSFGTGWVREGAFELFAQSVRLHDPLLPIVGEEDPMASVRAGGVPALDEVRLHQSTVWRWNRAIYDPAGGGHLRIEMRALPAGPTVLDMLANAAFFVGLALGLAPHAEDWIAGLSFERAHTNFYRAARSGLDAELGWPPEPGDAPVPVSARELVPRLLPLAREGLGAAGVESADSEPLLDIVCARAESGRTAARWQRRMLEALDARLERSEALGAMLERYLTLSESDVPVHRWTEEA